MINFWAIIWTIVIGYVVHNLYTFYNNISHFRKHKIPINRPWWLLGNMWKPLLRITHLSQIVQEFYTMSPGAKYVALFDFSSPVLIIRDPELIKSIAVKNSENFPDHRGFVNEKLDPLFGLNLFSLKGQKWHSVRTMLSPAFTSSKMKMMFQLMADCSAQFADFILEESRNGKNIFEMKDIFTRYTNDVIATCAFGIQIDSMREPRNDFYILGRKATNFDGILSLKFFLLRSFPRIVNIFKLRLIEDKIAHFFTNVIKHTIDARDEDKIIRPDMIQLMMDARGKENELNIDEMTAQAFIFFFGGFDTTSTLMCFVAHEIAVNPDIQKKLQTEVDEVWKKTNGKIDYETFQNMPYMDAVINETLRMYPPALFADRLCSKEFQLPPTLPGHEPYTIKPGTNVWFPLYGLQHDPQYFSNPEKFDPERFYQKQVTVNHKAFMPFGLGPRMCIGNRFALQEIKIVLFQLLARCNFKICSKTCLPMQFSISSFVLLAKGGFWIKLEPRKLKIVEYKGRLEELQNMRNGSVTA